MSKKESATLPKPTYSEEWLEVLVGAENPQYTDNHELSRNPKKERTNGKEK